MVLLRDGPDGPEVLLTVRPNEMRFMGGAAVFPGGAMSRADLDPRWERASSLTRVEAEALLQMNDPSAALGTMVCVLREAFEEVGFLIGSGPLERIERSTSDDPGGWLEHCLELGVVLGTDALVPAGRWVTPIGSPVRFDTRFFAARVPDGWEPRPEPSEVESCLWVSHRRAAEELEGGRIHMAPPTIEVLHRLEGVASAEEALRTLAGGVGSPGGPWITRLHPLVRLVLAPNPGPLTGPGTNTYVVGRPGESCFVIDPAVAGGRYLDVVAEAAGAVAGLIVTHRHPDHIGGVAALVERTGAPIHAFGDAPISGVGVTPISDGDELICGRARLVVVHTPGHASDHVCLRLDGGLFSGDTILGEGTAVIAPPDGDMRAYLTSLRLLLSLPIERVWPGHFRARTDARSLIEGYLTHRIERERAIIGSLGESGATIEQVVGRVYSDTPSALHPIAAYSVQAHLEMAEEDGRVKRAGDLWVRLPRAQVSET